MDCCTFITNNRLKMAPVRLFFAIALLLFSSCKKKTEEPKERHFYMGVTPWPADFTVAAVNDAYSFINQHCDLVSQHFDNGIPYQEAFDNAGWPQALTDDINTALTKTAPGKAVLLSVAPLALDRKSKADYYANSPLISTAVKDAWRALPVNDPKVVTAYVNFVSYLLNRLNPRFVNFGVESNNETFNAAVFTQYKSFLQQVYTQLKNRFPSLPFFVSFMVSEHPQALENARQLLPYTDYVTLSSYPYTSVSSSANGNTDPKLFPADYYSRFLDLANSPAKPVAIAETGYIAENLDVNAFNLHKQGNEGWQRDYLEKIFNLCEERKAKFLVWFCNQDYDAGNRTLQQLGLYQDLFAFWEDTGLYDEQKRERPAGALWREWMQRERK
ncbi:MAG: hypothetical protein JNM68_08695 [Dinghuibacter sp.]|nr:hypothetical protein [Dinghuibacter sp.]